MADKIATLHLPGKEPVELPILSGTVGPDVIDVRKLGAQGYFTFDPGFMATGACKSSITYIDGDQGVLLHRGYPIAQLATQASYLEVCYILLYGEAPTKTQYAEFERLVTRHTMVHEQIAFFFRGFRRDSHPMAIMCGVVSALSAFYHDALDINNEEHREICAFRLLSKMPTLAAMCYKYSIGQPFMQPRNALSYAGNFLHMMFGVPTEEYKVNPIVERAMDRIFTLHADHEQNASTSTVRLAGSSGANPFACIAAGIASLWGPAHGGANEACLKMLEEIGSVVPRDLQLLALCTTDCALNERLGVTHVCLHPERAPDEMFRAFDLGVVMDRVRDGVLTAPVELPWELVRGSTTR